MGSMEMKVKEEYEVKVEVKASLGSEILHHDIHVGKVLIFEEPYEGIVGVLILDCESRFCKEINLTDSDIAMIIDHRYFDKFDELAPGRIALINYKFHYIKLLAS